MKTVLPRQTNHKCQTNHKFIREKRIFYDSVSNTLNIYDMWWCDKTSISKVTFR